jgi:hypothetical protein
MKWLTIAVLAIVIALSILAGPSFAAAPVR